MNTPPHNFMNGLRKNLVSDKWLEEFEKCGKGELRMLTGSMTPMIQSGDQIWIEKVAPSKVKRGDIITFWKGHILVTHRVIKKVKKGRNIYFIERADSYPFHSFVSTQLLVGRVRKIIKRNKSYNLNAVQWQLFNRLLGTLFYFAFNTRMIGRKITFFPKPITNYIKKIYQLLGRLTNKIIKSMLLFKNRGNT